MARDDVFISRKGYEELCEKLKYLKGAKRTEISKAIGEAIAQGDLSENAEYDAAKEAQGLNEKRIAELGEKLANAQILGDNISKDEVLVGATVELKDLDSGEELEYTLVSELEADFSQGKISVDSPIGKGLLGHKKNEVVKITVPAGILRYKILKISR